ncbi:MAG TPA: hypothetical protein VGB18_08120 [Candidatus Thermoplasmatota archaeon]
MNTFLQSLAGLGVWGHALISIVVGFPTVNILWYPLGAPAYLLNVLTKWIGPSDCIQYAIGTGAAQRCALTVGLKVVLGPIIVGVIMFLLPMTTHERFPILVGATTGRKAIGNPRNIISVSGSG